MFPSPAFPTLLLLLLAASSLVASIPAGGDPSTVNADTGAADSIDIAPTLESKILELVFKSDYDEAEKKKIKEEFDSLEFPSDKEVERMAELVTEHGEDLSKIVEAAKEAPLRMLLEAAITQDKPFVVQSILRFPPDGFSQDKVVLMALETATLQDKGQLVETILLFQPEDLSDQVLIDHAIHLAYRNFNPPPKDVLLSVGFLSNNLKDTVLRAVLKKTRTSDANKCAAIIQNALSKIRRSTFYKDQLFVISLTKILDETHWHTLATVSSENFNTSPMESDRQNVN